MSIPTLPAALAGEPIYRVARSELPLRILHIEQLAELIGKTPTTIRTFASNPKYQHLIPPAWKLPNSRRLCWLERDVLAWIESTQPVVPPPARRKPGRPTKREEQARKHWAARQNSGN